MNPPPEAQVRINLRPFVDPPAKHQPMPLMVHLQRSREKLSLNSLEPSTRDAYARAYKHWLRFAAHYSLDPLPTTDTLSLFITWRFQCRLASLHSYPGSPSTFTHS